MIGFVYEWTNKINSKKYIGSHGGSPDDAYIGSGVAFKNALKKHGIHNFQREILYVGEDYKNEEAKLLSELNAAKSKEYYNITNSACGASLPGQLNGMHGKKMSMASKQKISTTMKNAYANGTKKTNSTSILGSNNPMFGKSSHTNGIVKYAKQNTGKTYEEIHGEIAALLLRTKLSAAHAGKKQNWVIVACPHCKLTSRGPNMKRYHFDKCKSLSR